MQSRLDTPAASLAALGDTTRFKVLGAISTAHFLNDMIQSLVLALYPLLKASFTLSFAQIGLITLTYQASASLLQPLIGLYTDRRPQPHSLALAMTFTLLGITLLAYAPSFPILLTAAAMVGIGSAIFHPESSRVARMASGGRHGLAQSIFQVGGNSGSAIGPLIAAAFILPYGRQNVAWFALVALAAIVILWNVGKWYRREQVHIRSKPRPAALPTLPRKQVAQALAVLTALVFSKYFYLSSLHSYYTFYLIEKFHLSVQAAQINLFIFLAAIAIGTLLGGPIGDRIGRVRVIWGSILGAAPFTLALPHANLGWTIVLSFIIGFVIASAFSAIVVYAQELLPTKIGMVSGLFFGLAFGMGGVGAAVLGQVADSRGIVYVYQMCAYLPLLGLLTIFLPDPARR